LGQVGDLVWVEFAKNWGVGGDRGTMIAVFEISQQIPSDCVQPKFPSVPLLSSEKIQMLQIGRRFDRVLVGNSQTFLSL
jgi:hypothetical protein